MRWWHGSTKSLPLLNKRERGDIMAAGKEIRNKMTSIKKTQKITKAMELVAASKMRVAQDRMAKTRPYAKKMMQVIHHLANCNPEYHHPYLQPREQVKRVGVIVVSSDRGLCGGLNNTLFKQIISKMQAWEKQAVEVDLCVIGQKAAGFFRRFSKRIVGHAAHLGDTPNVGDLIGIVQVMLERYDDQKIDRLYIAHNNFVNTMKQDAVMLQLLPLANMTEKKYEYHWDYIYEPDAKHLLDLLLKRYIESQVYQAVVENIACEQAARMVAMKSATDNAGQLIDDLKLVYNKARQAVITREIAEIVSGADAV
jgi:F-type H+-transporting ATPase subunit gamma